MKTNDYVKYVTQTFVKYMDQPRDERKKQKESRRDEKEPFLFKWFGIIPYALLAGMKKGKAAKRQ
jgi:hypothetical protein